MSLDKKQREEEPVKNEKQRARENGKRRWDSYIHTVNPSSLDRSLALSFFLSFPMPDRAVSLDGEVAEAAHGTERQRSDAMRCDAMRCDAFRSADRSIDRPTHPHNTSMTVSSTSSSSPPPPPKASGSSSSSSSPPLCGCHVSRPSPGTTAQLPTCQPLA